MISKKTEYALKALVYLAQHHGKGPVLISDLAKANKIPKKFLEAILLSLRKGKILNSRIGKGGGYFLAATPADITIGMVVRILEGEFAPVQCMSNISSNNGDLCCDLTSCGIRLVMEDVKSAISVVLDSTTLSDMQERSETARKVHSNILDYCI